MADSFNELFGLGSHSDDASIEGWWPLQDNAATTTVLDRSGNSLDGTLAGGDNTADKDDTGPNSWLPSALHFNGTDDYVSLPLSALGSDDLTLLAMMKIDVEPPGNVVQTGFGKFGEVPNGSASGSHYPFTDSVVYCSTWRGTGATTFSRVTVGNPTPALTDWHNVCVKTTPGADGWKFRLDGSSIATATGITGVYTGGANWRFGQSQSLTDLRYLDGSAAHVSIFSRHLSDAEEADAFAGPEPVNSVAPAVSGTEEEDETLSVTSGTWGLPSPLNGGSNGTITYAYQWTRSDDASGTGEADIGGATSSTYTLVSADVGSFLRCRVRATNDGGFDSDADANSDFTGEIEAAGGGGAAVGRGLFSSSKLTRPCLVG